MTAHLTASLAAVITAPAMPRAMPSAAPSVLAGIRPGAESGIAAEAGVLGALTGLGLVLAVDGARPRPRPRPRRETSRESDDGIAAGRGLAPVPAFPILAYLAPVRPHPANTANTARAASVAGAAGVAAGVVTGWPVAGLLAAAAAWWLLRLYRDGRPGSGRAGRTAIARIEAIATWTEELRDVLSAATGLEQALLTTAPLVPDAIASPITRMATRIRAGDHLPDALRVAGDELADPTADLVIAALITAASRQGGDLAGLLGELAETAREHAAMRLRVRAEQARIRSAAQIITGATMAMAAGLMLGSPHFLRPYDDVAGQLVLAGIGVVFTAGFAWLHRLGQIREPGRILGTAISGAAAGRAEGAHAGQRGEAAP